MAELLPSRPVFSISALACRIVQRPDDVRLILQSMRISQRKQQHAGFPHPRSSRPGDMLQFQVGVVNLKVGAVIHRSLRGPCYGIILSGPTTELPYLAAAIAAGRARDGVHCTEKSIKMKSDNLLDIPDPDAPLFRIYSKHRFLDLLRTRKNALVKPRLWNDPFENFFLRSDVTGPKGEKISIKSLAEDWYGQCWTLNEDTDAMWRIYSHCKNGVKVRTTIRKLFDSFYDGSDKFADLKFLIGKVQYQTTENIADFMSNVSFYDIASGGQATGFAKLLCVKREAFEYEREVRLLFQDLDPKRSKGDAVLFDFDVNAMCEDVVIDPRFDEGQVAAFKDEIAAVGCTLPISQSSLYRAPNFTIRLQ